MFVSRCFVPDMPQTEDVIWDHMTHLRGGGGAGAAATARKRQERLLLGLQTLLHEFMPNPSQPQQMLQKEKKKKKNKNDLIGALTTLLQRHTDDSKKRDQPDLLVALQRLVKAATDGKIPMDDRPKPKPPEKPQQVAKAKAKPVKQMSQDTKSYADMVRKKSVTQTAAKPVSQKPQYKLWKTADKPDQVSTYNAVRQQLEKGECPKAEMILATADQLGELQLLRQAHELKPSTVVVLPDDAIIPENAKQTWIQQYPKKGPELKKLHVVPLCDQMPNLPSCAVKKVAAPQTESESGVLRITIPKVFFSKLEFHSVKACQLCQRSAP